MANKNLFSNNNRAAAPAADTRNRSGGLAYATGAEHSLAQYACTGMFGNTYHTSAKTQLVEVLGLARKVSPEFLAKCAVYSRKRGYLKDMPAFLLAVLSTRDVKLFKKAFPQVIDNGRMVRNFVQIMRSGAVGRTSLGSAPKKMVKKWFERSSNDYLFKQTVGNDPSLADIIKMVHPSPADKETSNLYSYIIGRGYDRRKKYPAIVKEFEEFKKAKGRRKVPDVPFQMLTSQGLTDREWAEIAKNGKWQFTRMNLNNFAKYKVFDDRSMVKLIANRLRDEGLVSRSRQFPYQLFQTYRNLNADVPRAVKTAVQDALDISVSNIPEFDTAVHVGVDCSGSMGSPANGAGYSYRGNGQINCNEVASLFASAIYKTNDEARIYRFDSQCTEVTELNPRDSVISNATKIGTHGGATDCGSFIRLLNAKRAKGDLVIMVSDNESWYGPTGRSRGWGSRSATGFQDAWKAYKKRNPRAVLVCIDITPGITAQAKGKDVLLVGGFSDNVFNVVSKFYESKGDNTFWVKEINESVSID